MQTRIYLFIATLFLSSITYCTVFSQTTTFVRPGQLFSIQVEKSVVSPLYVQLSPTHLRQQDTIVFSALDKLPGSAIGLDYGRFFRNVQAFTSDGQPLSVRRISTNKWEITGSRALKYVTYEVLIHEAEEVIKDQSATGRRRPGYLFFPGAAIFAYLEGHEQGYQRVDINKPGGWQLVSNIESVEDGAYAANNFSELIHAPFAMGSEISVHRFTAFEIPHVVTIYDDGERLPSAVGISLENASQAANILYKTTPIQSYFAFIELLKTTPSGRNGKSWRVHAFANGLHIIIPLSHLAAEEIQDKMLMCYLQSWLSHKRYFTSGAQDFYSQRYAYGEWLLEGLSMYYSARLLTQIGAMSYEKFLQKITAWTNDVLQHSTEMTRDLQVVANNTRHPHSSLASRGALLGLLLDVQILYQSRGYKRLDDGLHTLEKTFQKTNEKMQITQFPHLILEATGIDVERFFHTYLETEAALPLPKAFSTLGLQPKWENARLDDLTMQQPDKTPKQARQLRRWWLKKITVK